MIQAGRDAIAFKELLYPRTSLFWNLEDNLGIISSYADYKFKNLASMSFNDADLMIVALPSEIRIKNEEGNWSSFNFSFFVKYHEKK